MTALRCAGIDKDPLCVVDPSNCPEPREYMYDVSVPEYNGQKNAAGVAFTAGDSWDGMKVIHYPKMTKDEVLIFKTFDSAEGFVPTMHGSFEDPTAAPGARSRESCESRIVLLIPVRRKQRWQCG